MERLSLGLGPSLRVSVEGLGLENEVWSSEDPLLHIDSMAASLSLTDLLSRRLQAEVELEGLEILLERDLNGLESWASSEAGPSPDETPEEDAPTAEPTAAASIAEDASSPSSSSSFEVKGLTLSLKDCRLRYQDHLQGKQGSLLIQHSELSYDGESLQLDLAGEANDSVVDLSASLKRTPAPEPGSPKGWDGAIHFNELDLVPVTLPSNSEAEEQVATAPEAPEPPSEETPAEDQVAENKAKKKTRLFSEEPLNLAFLQEHRVRIHLSGEQLRIPGLALRGVDLHSELNEGRLELDMKVNQIGSGFSDLQASVDTRAVEPHVEITLFMKDASLSDSRGLISAVSSLEAHGASPAELAASLDGFLVLHAKDFRLQNSILTQFGQGILEGINPLGAKEAFSRLDCAIVAANIEQGRLDSQRKIAIQMSDVTWFGGLSIDLKTESLDAGVHSKPRGGSGVSLGGLAKMVHVGGTLAKPKIQLDPKEVATQYGSYGVAVATGGISLIFSSMYGKSQANADVCADILEAFELELKQREPGHETP